MYSTIVSAQQLAQLLAQPGQSGCILDCRFSLADAGYGRRLYGEGHIAGAHYLDLDQDLASPVGPDTGRHPLPDTERLIERLGACGVTQGAQVVVYDDCGGAMAARAWWLLCELGVATVAVLDGGFQAWQAFGGAVDTRIPAGAPPSVDAGWPIALSDQGMVNTADVLENLDDAHFTLVDARSAERFRGEKEPIDPVAGHIPGALSHPLTDNLDKGCFKSPEALRKEWLAILGEHRADTVVHMCGSGITACHNQLAMQIAGLDGSRLYPGSWSEWIRDPERPVATGPA